MSHNEFHIFPPINGYDGAVCDDCAMFCVNADTTAMGHERAVVVEEADPERYWVIGGRLGFMRSACDRCRTPLHGDRHGGNAFG